MRVTSPATENTVGEMMLVLAITRARYDAPVSITSSTSIEPEQVGCRARGVVQQIHRQLQAAEPAIRQHRFDTHRLERALQETCGRVLRAAQQKSVRALFVHSC